MTKRFRLILLILSLMLLSSCGYDESSLTQTHRPSLNQAPIEGVWKIDNVIASQSRFGLYEGARMYFDVDLFVLNNDTYTNPSYEVQRLSWSEIKGNSNVYSQVRDFDDDSIHHLIRISNRSQVLAEIVPIDEENALLATSNQVFEIKLINEKLTEDEKNSLVQATTSSSRIYTQGSPWAIVIGTRDQEDSESEFLENTYKSIVIYHESGEYKIEKLDGIIIKEKDSIDHYEIKREDLGDGLKDHIYLNGDLRPIVDVNGQRQADFFNVDYISNDYMSLEYLKEDANTLSTYSTRTKGGFTQLNSDDIIDFSSGRIYEFSRNINNVTPMSQATYNIGFDRENGLSILKSRLTTEVDDILVNRDFALSGDFSVNEARESKYNLDRRLRTDNPNMKDFYQSPDADKVLVVTDTDLILYDLAEIQNRQTYLTELRDNTTIVSFASFADYELDQLKNFTNSR